MPNLPDLPSTTTLVLILIGAAVGLYIYNWVRRWLHKVGSVVFVAASAVAIWYLWTQLGLHLPGGSTAPKAVTPAPGGPAFTLPSFTMPGWAIPALVVLVVLVVLYVISRVSSARQKDAQDAPRKPANAGRVNNNNDDSEDN